MAWRAANHSCSTAWRGTLLLLIRRMVPPLSVVDQTTIASTIGGHAIRASTSPALPSHPRSRHTARK
jgi:hypothetical protein